MKIIFTGGGSGGHIFPIIAVCREIKKRYSGKDLKLYYFGPSNEKEVEKLLEKEGIKIKKIITGKIRRYFSFKNFFDFLKVPLGIIQSFFWLFFIAPDIIFSKGGHGSFPIALMGEILNIPLFLHESDMVPGLASKIESKWAIEIFVSFLNKEAFPTEKIVCLGNPVREEVKRGSKEEAKRIFNLKGDKPLLLIIGGSQGSRPINETIIEMLPDLLNNCEVIHQTGKKNFSRMRTESKAIIPNEEILDYYHLKPFLNEKEYGNALKGADIVISRAGAGSIFEIAVNGKPSILIPLEKSAQDHQLKNAYSYAESGGAKVIEQRNLEPGFLLEKIRHLLSRPDLLKEMSQGAYSFARPRAAEIIASYLLEYSRAMEK